jgi:SAM-dependent methyltransferase
MRAIKMDVKQLCPGCNSASAQDLLFHKDGIPIYKCKTCGLGMAQTRGFNPENYYDASYFNGGRSDGYSDYVGAEQVLRDQFRRDINLLKSLGSKSGNLLELGCAYGYFLEVARDSYGVSGLEICRDAVTHCQMRGLKDVRQGAICSQALRNFPEVDVVVMLDVIEHLPDPMETLVSAASKLRQNGLMLITTGDFSSLCAKLTKQHWRLMTPPQHLWFFTPHSLRKMGEKIGLDLIHLDYPFKKVPLGLIIYQLCRYISLKPNLPSWFHRVGLPINLFDAMRVVFRKRSA